MSDTWKFYNLYIFLRAAHYIGASMQTRANLKKNFFFFWALCPLYWRFHAGPWKLGKKTNFLNVCFLRSAPYIGDSMQTRGNFRKYNVLKVSFFSAPYSGDSMQTHGNLKNLISKIFVFLALCLYIGDAMQTCRNSKNTIFNFYFSFFALYLL